MVAVDDKWSFFRSHIFHKSSNWDLKIMHGHQKGAGGAARKAASMVFGVFWANSMENFALPWKKSLWSSMK
jgi:hypothetical protein